MTEENSPISRREKNIVEDAVVPLGLFGNDHWGVFLKVENAVKSNGGFLRTDRLNIAYSKRASFSPKVTFTREEYPTQIKASEAVRGDGRYGVRKVDGYDDIDCLGDLEREGLVDAQLPTVDNDQFIDPTGDVILNDEGQPLSPFDAPSLLENAILKRTRWSLTEYGTIIAFQLQGYRNTGKPLHSFVAAQPHGVI